MESFRRASFPPMNEVISVSPWSPIDSYPNLQGNEPVIEITCHLPIVGATDSRALSSSSISFNPASGEKRERI